MENVVIVNKDLNLYFYRPKTTNEQSISDVRPSPHQKSELEIKIVKQYTKVKKEMTYDSD